MITISGYSNLVPADCRENTCEHMSLRSLPKVVIVAPGIKGSMASGCYNKTASTIGAELNIDPSALIKWELALTEIAPQQSFSQLNLTHAITYSPDEVLRIAREFNDLRENVTEGLEIYFEKLEVLEILVLEEKLNAQEDRVKERWLEIYEHLAHIFYVGSNNGLVIVQ